MSVEELRKVHPEAAIIAAQYECRDLDAVADLLSYGYTVWDSRQHVVDDYLDGSNVPQLVRDHMDYDKLWKGMKRLREFVGTPSGKLVEFHK